MYLVANRKNLKEIFPEKYRELDKIINGTVENCKQYKSVIDWINQCYNVPSKNELKLCAVNEILQTYGTEPIRIEGQYIDSFHYDIVASYCNNGDTYNTTILNNHKNGKFYITSYGDFIEKFYL